MTMPFRFAPGCCFPCCNLPCGTIGTICSPEQFIVVSGTYDTETHMLSPGGIVTVDPNVFPRFLVHPVYDCIVGSLPVDLDGLQWVYGGIPVYTYQLGLRHAAVFYGDTQLTATGIEEGATVRGGHFDIDENGFYVINGGDYLGYLRTPIRFENARPGIKNNAAEPRKIDALLVYPVGTNPYSASANCKTHDGHTFPVDCILYPSNALQGYCRNEFSDLFNGSSMSLTFSGFAGFGGDTLNQTMTLTPTMDGISQLMWKMEKSFSYTQSVFVPVNASGDPVASPENYCAGTTPLNFDLTYNVLVTAEMQAPQQDYYDPTPCGMSVKIQVDIPRVFYFNGQLDASHYLGNYSYVCYSKITHRDYPERKIRLYAGGFTATIEFLFPNVTDLYSAKTFYDRRYVDNNIWDSIYDSVPLFGSNGLLPGVSDEDFVTEFGKSGWGYLDCEYETKLCEGQSTQMTWSKKLPIDPEMYAFKIAGNPTCKVNL